MVLFNSGFVRVVEKLSFLVERKNQYSYFDTYTDRRFQTIPHEKAFPLHEVQSSYSPDVGYWKFETGAKLFESYLLRIINLSVRLLVKLQKYRAVTSSEFYPNDCTQIHYSYILVLECDPTYKPTKYIKMRWHHHLQRAPGSLWTYVRIVQSTIEDSHPSTPN